MINEGTELDTFKNDILKPIVGLEKIKKVPKTESVDLWTLDDNSVEYLDLSNSTNEIIEDQSDIIEKETAVLNCSELLLKETVLFEDDKYVESVSCILKTMENGTPTNVSNDTFKDLNNIKYENER